ncbi:MAG: DUF5320 domain-containing protein [Desulfobacteraceae bacterium]|nr:DUF5320 domain-containing protein [Desulfobacteraceae bacterium]
MPGGDRTGPIGAGPMTGRGAGFCSGFGAPGFANPVPGRGFGMGFGRARGRGQRGRFFGGGFGWRNRFFATGIPGRAYFGPYAAPDPEAEKQGLKQEAEALQAELDMIRKRLDEFEPGSES